MCIIIVIISVIIIVITIIVIINSKKTVRAEIRVRVQALPWPHCGPHP